MKKDIEKKKRPSNAKIKRKHEEEMRIKALEWTTMNVKLPKLLLARVDALKVFNGMSRSEIMIDALDHFVTQQFLSLQYEGDDPLINHNPYIDPTKPYVNYHKVDPIIPHVVVQKPETEFDKYRAIRREKELEKYGEEKGFAKMIATPEEIEKQHRQQLLSEPRRMKNMDKRLLEVMTGFKADE